MNGQCSSKSICISEQRTSLPVAELYFLIQKFLAGGPLKKTQEVLRKELEEYKIFEKRTDWEGNKHDRAFEDMEHQFPYIMPDYLLEICCQIGKTYCTKNDVNANDKFSLLKYKPQNLKELDYNFKQLYNYIGRRHGVPIRNKKLPSNLVNVIRGRETSGNFPRSLCIMPKTYSSIQIQRRTIGHLSAVYCLLFDATGKYILTGADDLLIKLWSSNNGRLIATFRGAFSEISDIAINVENTLLAAGSLDRILRIWNIQTGAPVAVLPGHSGMITSVKFCPSSCWNSRYVITTSTDGTVAFWPYTSDSCDKVNFKATPIVYQEKIRPGQAQMICSSFSPGGSFLATGSADHNVRVYYMKGDEGPQRILEIELHTDRVDSIQWAHSGIRFLSGSKDGNAIVWYFEGQQWKHTFLNMGSKTASNSRKSGEDAKKLRVTMVAWDLTDELVVTAVSDYTLKVWRASNGQLERVMTGHTDEVYVLEPHPHDAHVMMSAGHDGQVFIWDILKGEIINRFINTIEGQGFGAIFDGKWSPDGCKVALSDSHGHILIFGFGPGSPIFQQLPLELFFHTDYRPLVRDASNYVLDEQTQVPPHLMPPPFLVDMDGNPYPPAMQRLVAGREHCNTEQLVPNIVFMTEGRQEVIQGLPEEARNDGDRYLNAWDNAGTHDGSFRSRNRRSREEGIRQSTGDWQRDPNMKWKKNILVQPLKYSDLRKAQNDIEHLAQAEIDEYHRQMCQRPHMINTSALDHVAKMNEKKNKNKQKAAMKRTETVTYFENDESSEDMIYSDSSAYSDWVAEEGANLEPPKRLKRRQVTHKIMSESEESEPDEPREARKVETSSINSPKKEKEATPKAKTEPAKTKPVEVPEKFQPSEWLSETKPRKSPYFPQMGDELVYFVQGHQLYIAAVQLKNVYEVNVKELPWSKMQLKDYEYAKIIGIRYEIKPPRLCCLKLAIQDEDGRLTGKNFTIKYHDMPDVLDFLVLKQTYSVAVSRHWKPGDRFRCIIDEGWWLGEVISTSSSSEEHKNSPFMCYEIKWDNGEIERMSPWDLEIVDENRVPEDPLEAVPVLNEELAQILYKPTPEDWPNSSRESACKHILNGLGKIMELAIAEPFLVPVDLSVYPQYAFVVEYPIDLSTIRARFENHFYRRVTAAQFDIRYLATNAEKFNERHSVIVKNARILMELCLRVLKQYSTDVDVNEMYRQLVESYYDSSDAEVDIENLPSTSRSLRSLPKSQNLPDAADWKLEALGYLEAMFECEDSLPFRQPVNLQKYPDYKDIVKHPMDLSTVKKKLQKDEYRTPYEFSNDMKLIFKNSRRYNTNQRSRIYVMTVRLSATFQEYHNKLIRNWTMAKRRQARRNRRKSNSSSRSSEQSTTSKSLASSVRTETRTPEYSDEDNSDDTPLNFLVGKHNQPSSSHSTFVTNGNLKNRTVPSEATSDMTSEDEVVNLRKLSKRKARLTSSDSEESYKRPKRKKGRLKSDSSDSDSFKADEKSNSSDASLSTKYSDSDSDNKPLMPVRTRPKRNIRPPPRCKDYLTSDSDQVYTDVSHSRRKRRKISSNSETELNGRRRSSSEQSVTFTSVSSRGRIRKLTPRAQALMKK